MRIRPFREEDTDQIVALWRECGLVRPWNDPHRDIRRKLDVQPELFLVGDTVDEAHEADPVVVASIMAGYDGHRGWVNYLAVAPGHRGAGVARTLMAEAERMLVERGCPKLNLQVRADNAQALGFYRAIGYLDDHSVSLGKRLISDGVDKPAGA